MDQVTALCHLEVEYGTEYYVTDYLAECGCHWRVDMWGNVRTVVICHRCNSRWVVDPQLALLFESPNPSD